MLHRLNGAATPGSASTTDPEAHPELERLGSVNRLRLGSRGNGTTVVLPELLLDHAYVPSNDQIGPASFLFALCLVVPVGLLVRVRGCAARAKGWYS